MELLKNVDPKEYEKYARMYGITDFRGLLQAFELLKQSEAEETHRLVWFFADNIIKQIHMWAGEHVPHARIVLTRHHLV